MGLGSQWARTGFFPRESALGVTWPHLSFPGLTCVPFKHCPTAQFPREETPRNGGRWSQSQGWDPEALNRRSLDGPLSFGFLRPLAPRRNRGRLPGCGRAQCGKNRDGLSVVEEF